MTMTKEKNNLDFNQVGHEGSVKFDIKSFKDRSRGSLKTIFTHMFPNGKIRGNEFVVGDLNGAPGDSCSFNLDKDGVGSEFNGGQSFSDFIDVWQKVYGCNFAEAVRDISNKFAISLIEEPIKPQKTLKAQNTISPSILLDLNILRQLTPSCIFNFLI